MAKQSFISPVNSVLLQVLKMTWLTTKNCKRFELYFDATRYSKDTDHSTPHKLADTEMTQLAGAIISSISSTQCCRSFFNCRASDAKYFNHNFSCSVENLSIFTTPLNVCSGSRCHDTMRKHFTLPGSIICANFSFIFVDLALANVLDDRSTILWRKVPIFPLVSVFHAYCQRLKYIPALLQFQIFSAFTLQGVIKQVTSYDLLVRWTFEQSV